MRTVTIGIAVGAMACALLVQPVSAIEAGKSKEKVLYAFGSGTDGANPYASLIDAKGSTLYGTTYIGGANGAGAVFALDPNTGIENVVHSFGDGTDGRNPYADLIEVNGTLYGTTFYGGAADDGTVFAIDLETGAENVLYSFCSQRNCTDGLWPGAGLIHSKGVLYGTTGNGGANGGGSVFVIDLKTGAQNVLYSFCSQQNCRDGRFPYAGVIDANGTLYGATWGGGAYSNVQCGSYGCGTVFALNSKTGVEKVLYSFCSQQNCADGNSPQGNLIDVNGTLYGTTPSGGACCGTVFALDPDGGAETVVHSFTYTDGASPFANLITVKGALYGTTTVGGAYNQGTVFSIDLTSGAETVLHSFKNNGADGEDPEAGLLSVKGTLYGTTYAGGAHGDGTVFLLKP